VVGELLAGTGLGTMARFAPEMTGGPAAVEAA
jgi:hypothetical protein